MLIFLIKLRSSKNLFLYERKFFFPRPERPCFVLKSIFQVEAEFTRKQSVIKFEFPAFYLKKKLIMKNNVRQMAASGSSAAIDSLEVISIGLSRLPLCYIRMLVFRLIQRCWLQNSIGINFYDFGG